MKKILIGLTLVTAVATTTGLAAAQNNGNGNGNGYGKDQCKNGGWQELGFRNQGECVSFFARNKNTITNVNNVDVTANTDQTAVSGSVDVSHNGSTGDVFGGNASTVSNTDVSVSASN